MNRMMDARRDDGLYDAMRAAGLEFKGSIAWNERKAQRYTPASEKGHSKHAWYWAHDDADGVCVTFGSWRDGSQHLWFPADRKSRTLSDAERQRIEEVKRAADAERKVEIEVARRKAEALWDSLPTHGDSAYLTRKKIGWYGVRFAVNVPRERFGWDPGQSKITGLIVPGWHIEPDLTLTIKTLQVIFDNGSKFFFGGAEASGACSVIGDLESAKRILLCEGYATGATLYESTGLPVVCAFMAGNLTAVAKLIRKRYPSAMITICGDDDRWHEPGKRNSGQVETHAAAAAVGCGWVLPTFPDDAAASKPTDFNDLFALLGADEVRRQVLGIEPPAEDDVSDAGGHIDDAAGGSDRRLVYSDDIDHLAQNFVLLYGSDMLWDDANRRLIKISQAKEAFPQSYKIWRVMGAGRRVMAWEDVVFEPNVQGNRPGTINLFDGIEMSPAKGDCGLICDHLRLLCGRDPEITHWVTSWLAYPLKHIGAKMQTCLVFHGKTQGTGKNLFFEKVMGAIYGQWSRVITQRELESQYTEWLSRKLYIVGNEIATPKELGNLRGPLKQMISDDTFPIQQKFCDTRTERNHVNIVFLGNSVTAPIPIEADDRRYMTVRIEEKMPDAYYDALVSQIKGGGVPAFYQYLLDYDIGDFSPTTKPISTDDRRALLHAAKLPSVRFIEEWMDGMTIYPVIPAPASSLYEAYRRWCGEVGEKATSNIHFSRQIADMVIKSENRYDIPQYRVTESGYLDEMVGKTVRTHVYTPLSFSDRVTHDVIRAAAADWADRLLTDAAMKKRMRT